MSGTHDLFKPTDNLTNALLTDMYQIHERRISRKEERYGERQSRKKKQPGDNGDGCEGEKPVENWIDSIAGASALNRRRLVRVIDAGDTRMVVYAGAQRLLVADCTSGSLIECAQPHSERVSALASDGGRLMVTGGEDKKLVVWEIPSMTVRSQVTTEKKIISVVLDPSGSSVIFAEKAGEVFRMPVADTSTKAEHLLGHISSLTDMAMSPTGGRILTADRDEKIRISHYPQAYEIDSYCLGHTALVTCMCVWSQEGKELVLSGGADGTLRLWALADGSLLHTLEVCEGASGGGEGGEGGEGGGAAEGATDKERLAERAASNGSKKSWDHMAAGTNEGTAAVSGRLRGKCQAAAVVAMTACGEAFKGAFAVSVEHRREVLFVSTAGFSIKQVGGTEFSCGAVGLATLEVGDTTLLVAASLGEHGVLLEARELRSEANGLEAREVDLLSAAGAAGVDDKTKAKRALGQLAAAIRQLPNEIPDAGQEQHVQKRRRDTEPA